MKPPFSNSFSVVWTGPKCKMLFLILAEQLGFRRSRRPRKALKGRGRRIGDSLKLLDVTFLAKEGEWDGWG